MLRLRNLSVPPDKDGREYLIEISAKALSVPPSSISGIRIIRRSIDARKKNAVRLIYTLDLQLLDEKRYLTTHRDAAVLREPEAYRLPEIRHLPDERPMIVGFGPAGMFAALALAEAGLKPLVLERGSDVETRAMKVSAFRERGLLDPECNVQFGEGGAGTFSDGKLNTGISGSSVSWVLHRFAEFGAGEEVMWDAAPHVGTDVLKTVVRNLRLRVCALGGEVRFDTKLVGLQSQNGILSGIVIEHAAYTETIPCTHLFLATGHSARDTVQMLWNFGIPMEAKAFAMGFRIEHLQRELDRAQFGAYAGMRSLGPASYKLSVHLPDGTGVYTFCMCPGGYVIAAASEIGGVVTNGMSYSGRAGVNGNAALLASLRPEQFPYGGPLGGMLWQRELEKEAFQYAGGSYAAPAQVLRDYLRGNMSRGAGRVEPSYSPGVHWGDFHEFMPNVITGPIQEAIPLLARKLNGFDDPEAVLTGPETRSSSPVRILRGSDYQSLGLRGLYPCGEGAGWAGGIVSAAVDALRCTEAYLESLG